MQAFRATLVAAALVVSIALEAQGSGGVTPKKHVNASKPSVVSSAPGGSPATSAAASPDVKVNDSNFVLLLETQAGILDVRALLDGLVHRGPQVCPELRTDQREQVLRRLSARYLQILPCAR